MKKILAFTLASLMALSLAGCGSTNNAENSSVASGAISLISREDGSGTRGAFVEITGILENDVDNTSVEAIIHDGTGKVMTAVAADKNAIGYISSGSVNDTIKALSIDGIAPNAEDIKNGTYPIQRPFILATKGEATGVAADFIKFILSDAGSEIILGRGFVDVSTGAYETDNSSGSIIIGGSTSVSPLMEKLVEAYTAVNPNAKISIEANGSSAGLKGANEGTFDIGMSSRELKDSEKAELHEVTIALDGIAVIVNNENTLNDISMVNVKEVYTGNITDFSELN